MKFFMVEIIKNEFITEGKVTGLVQITMDRVVITEIELAVPRRDIKVNKIRYRGVVALRSGDYIDASGEETTIPSEGLIGYASRILRLENDRSGSICEKYVDNRSL